MCLCAAMDHVCAPESSRLFLIPELEPDVCIHVCMCLCVVMGLVAPELRFLFRIAELESDVFVRMYVLMHIYIYIYIYTYMHTHLDFQLLNFLHHHLVESLGHT